MNLPVPLSLPADFFFKGANHSVIQRFIDKDGILIDNEQHIKHAANQFGIPSKLLATVLMAEVLDYTFADYFFDDQPFFDLDARSRGWVQLRTDNMRAKGIQGWNASTPRSEIRDAIENTETGVYVLAEYLAWLRDNPIPETYASQVLADLARWDSLNAEEEMSVSRAFAHARFFREFSG